MYFLPINTLIVIRTRIWINNFNKNMSQDQVNHIAEEFVAGLLFPVKQQGSHSIQVVEI